MTAPEIPKGRRAVIVSAVRTPIGSMGGSLSTISATKLGSIAIKGAIEKANISPSIVEECYLGNVCQAGLGQAPARQAALDAGLPVSCRCTTLNKVCASGSRAIALAAQDIWLGIADVVVAGGFESMSNIPYYLTKARFGYRMGNGELVDGMIKDGLWDPYGDIHMGNYAELCAKTYGFNRQEQDEFAIVSYKRAQKAHESGLVKDEIVAVPIEDKKKGTQLVTEDEEYTKANYEKVPSLRPVFQTDGTVTAANASSISDGAAALVIMSEEKAKELGVGIVAHILGFADAERAPEEFTVAPSLAIPRALEHARISLEEVDFFEINEAFSVVALANMKLLGLSLDKVNVFGGAVALGHPLGCSGARIAVTLLNVLKYRKGRIGVSAICNGGGGASALVLKLGE
eukprot:jgi/Galph1/3606/GphlegSOOS_G2289.1